MQQMQQQQQLDRVNVNQLAMKASSKKEIYNFLALECEAYLPKLDTINVHFLKQIMRATKEYIKRSAVKVAVVPQIEGLSVDDFIRFARERPDIVRCLPDERGWNHIDKKWMCDVIYTIDPQQFDAMLAHALQQRRTRLEQSQDQVIEMRPEFAQALQRSISFSSSRGKSAYLMKNSSKHKRKRAEIEEVKDEETQLKADKQGYLEHVKRLKRDHDELNQQMINLMNGNQTFESLQRQGFVDQFGRPIALSSQNTGPVDEDRIEIQSARSMI